MNRYIINFNGEISILAEDKKQAQSMAEDILDDAYDKFIPVGGYLIEEITDLGKVKNDTKN